MDPEVCGRDMVLAGFLSDFQRGDLERLHHQSPKLRPLPRLSTLGFHPDELRPFFSGLTSRAGLVVSVERCMIKGSIKRCGRCSPPCDRVCVSSCAILPIDCALPERELCTIESSLRFRFRGWHSVRIDLAGPSDELLDHASFVLFHLCPVAMDYRRNIKPYRLYFGNRVPLARVIWDGCIVAVRFHLHQERHI